VLDRKTVTRKGKENRTKGQTPTAEAGNHTLKKKGGDPQALNEKGEKKLGKRAKGKFH